MIKALNQNRIKLDISMLGVIKSFLGIMMKSYSNRKRKKEALNGRLIYERIKLLADMQKISIKSLALKAGFKSPNTIYNYKYGQNPNSFSLKAIANALKTTPEYLKGETDDWHKKESSSDQREENNSDEPSIADLNSPIFALNGQRITGEAAEDIRKYAEFVASRERNKEK